MDNFDAGIELGLPEDFDDLNNPDNMQEQGNQELQDGESSSDDLEIDELDESSNFDKEIADRSKQARMVADKLGKDAIIKIQFFVCAILVAIVILFLIAGGVTKAKRIKAEELAKMQPSDKVDTTHLQKDFPRLLNENMKVEDKQYQDRVVIKKYILLENGSCNFYFSGKPIYFGSDVAWQVPYNVYNAIPNDSSIKIQFNVVAISDSSGNVNEFMTNIEIVQPEV